jgi:hypothetical protein
MFFTNNNLIEFRNALTPLYKYNKKFILMGNLIKNRISVSENSLFKLNYCLSFSKTIYNEHAVLSNWPLFSIDEYSKLVDLFLEIIGFKRYVKDYVLICSYSFFFLLIKKKVN